MPKKTLTAILVSKITADQPDLIRDAVMYATATSEDVTEHIIAGTLKRIYFGAKRFQKYGDNTYTYGLPTVKFTGANPNIDAIKAAIGGEFNVPVNRITITNSVVQGDVNLQMYIYSWLKTNYDWNLVDNVMYTETDTTVVVREPGDVNGTTITGNTTVIIDDDHKTTIVTTEIYYDMTEEIEGILDVYSSVQLEATLIGPDPLDIYYQVYWEDSAEPGIVNAWVYNVNDTTYPALSDFASTAYGDEYYPIVTIRKNGTSINNNTTTLRYKTSKKLLKYISLDLEELITSVEANPDIGVINDVFITFSANIYSKVPATIKYLIRYFSGLAAITTVSAQESEANALLGFRAPNYLNFDEDELSHRIRYSYIINEIVTGVIGEVGFADSSWVGGSPSNDGYTGSITFREQLNDLEYRRVFIKGLVHISSVKLAETPAIFGSSITFTPIRTKTRVISDSNDLLEQDGFIIPMSQGILEQLSLKDRDSALYDSLYVLVQSIQIIKLKWYQTEAFGFLMQIVGIVLAIYTAGQSLVVSAMAGATAFAIAILKVAIGFVLLDQAVAWVFRNFSGTFAFIAALALTFLVGAALGNGDFMSNFNADNLLKSVTKMTDLYSAYTVEGIKKIEADYGKISQQYESALQDIENVRKELGLDSDIASMPLYMRLELIKHRSNFSESAEDYYARTVHNKNPGVASLDVIEHFAAAMLQLPKSTGR